MRILQFYPTIFKSFIITFICLLFNNNLQAQQTQISDYVIFGGKQTAAGQTAPLFPGYAVQLGSSTTISGGKVGSSNLIQTTGNSTINADIFSGGTIDLTNSNSVTGRLTAAGYTGTVISIGSNANINGNIDANGSILVNGGTVNGIVTRLSGTYSGPVPSGGSFINTPSIPILPAMPAIAQNLIVTNGNISNTTTLTPGNYGNLSLGNNKNITLNGVGNYFFNSINNYGNNIFIFDFKGNSTGTINIYVKEEANLGKVSTLIINGGSEGRIYLETQGKGTPSNPVAFSISNGNGGSGPSRWSGTVWAPFAAINIGSGTGSTVITGTLYSGTQVNIQSGVNVVYAPFNFCIPVTADAGPNQSGLATCGLTTVTLAANNPSPGTGKWTVVSGTGGSFSNDTSPTSTFTGTAGTSYTLRWTITSGSCSLSTADVTIVLNQKPATPTVTPTQPTCTLATGTITVDTPVPATGTTYSINGLTYTNTTGIFSGLAANTTYQVTVKNSMGCISLASSVTINTQPPTATINVSNSSQTVCSGTAIDDMMISNPNNVSGTTYSWTRNNTINITGIDASGSSALISGTLTNGTNTQQLTSFTITATTGLGCTTTTTAKVIVNPIPNVNAGPDKAMDFGTLPKLKGHPVSSTSTGISYNWVATNGGAIFNGATADEVTVSAAGTYTLKVTYSGSGCFEIDEALVTAKTKNIIGAELQSVYENRPTESPFFIIADGYIMIDVIVNAGNKDFVLNLLQQRTPAFPVDYGIRNFYTNGQQEQIIITGEYPIANLLNLNALGSIINYVRPYYQPFNNVGIVSSAGDTAMRSNFVRNGYGLNGAGIKIGVMSDSYATIDFGTNAIPPFNPAPGLTPQEFKTNTALQDVTNGDLPGTGNPNGFTTPVNILLDFPIKRSDEGRAMAQIVHDVAPGAQILFRTGFFTAGDFAKGIYDLKNAGCNIIVDDITYITEPFMKDGIVAKAVNDVKALGVSYFSAAGNFANKSYEDNFRPIDASALIGFSGKKAHNFSTSGTDMFQKVKLAPGNYTIVMQWVDDIYSLQNGLAGTQNDMDIYITPNVTGAGLIGFNRDNTGGDPIELMPFTVPGTDSIEYNVLIVNSTATSNPTRLKYIIYRGGIRIMEYNVGTSTLVGQSNAEGAITVGAARYDKVPPYLAVPVLESFSSIGGTKVEGVVRQKPDIVAPDGVNTTVRMGQDYPNTALDGYSNFFGTSAAAPHAAAAAALIMEGRKKFLPGVTNTTPDFMKSLLKATAIDMDVPLFDFNTGSGFINSDSAMRTFALPKATLIKLVVPSGVLPCSGSPFTITITGENFSHNTIVLVIKAAGDTTVIFPTFINTNAVSVTINSCEGNPKIQAYTPPKAGTNGLDGGFSNALYFFDASIVVNIDPITKKYGETLITPVPKVYVDDVLLENTNPLLTLADLGLTSMTVNTAATTNSDVGTYIIIPKRVFDPSNPVDAALLIKYNYKFTNGTVSISQLPLTVTPNNKTISFGNQVGKIEYAYNFSGNIPDPNAFTNKIKTAHQDFLAGNALAVIKGGAAISDAALANLNMIATFKAINNSRKFEIVNNKLVPLTDPNSINAQYLLDLDAQSIVDYNGNKALANFYVGSPEVNRKAMLGARALSENLGEVNVGTSRVKMINGSMVPMINAVNIGGSLVQMVNGQLMRLVAGTTNQYEIDPTANSLVQFINGSLVQLINGEYSPIPNRVVQFANGALLQMYNGTLVQMINNVATPIETGSLVPMINGSLVQILNGSLVQLINGKIVPITSSTSSSNSGLVQLINGALVQLINGSYQAIPNGSLVQMINGSLVSMINGSLVSMINGSLVQMINNSPEPIANSILVQLVNGSLVSLINGEYQPVPNGYLVQLVNGSVVTNSVATGTLVQYVNGAEAPIANNAELVSMVNGSLLSSVNNTLVQLINGSSVANSSMVQLVNRSAIANSSLVNGSLVSLVNSSLVQFVNASSLQQVNGTLVSLVNGSLVQLINNQYGSISNGALVSKVNGSLVQLVNGSLVQMVNSGSVGAGDVNNNTAVIFDETDVDPSTNNWLGAMAAINMVTGLGAGVQTIVPGTYVNPNFAVSYGLGKLTIEKTTVVITPIANQTKVYGTADPTFTFTNNAALTTFTGSLGRAAGSNVGTYAYTLGDLSAGDNYTLILSTVAPVSTFTITKRDVTVTATAGQTKFAGTADPASYTYSITSGSLIGTDGFSGALTRTAGESVGTYPIAIGTLTLGNNYKLTYVPANFTITINPCLIAHSAFKNFGNTPAGPTSLWMNVLIKISGQLNSDGAYISYSGGSIDLNAIIYSPTLASHPIPEGIIIAKAGVTEPKTRFNGTKWITEVPLGYSSTSAIFITGAIINSNNGFIKGNGNTNTVVSGIFNSSVNFSDQWTYGIAAYQPQFVLNDIAALGQVTSINGAVGSYSAGTPIPIIGNLVSGGSGNGSNSYSGSTASFDNFTACVTTSPAPEMRNAITQASIVQQHVPVINGILGDVQFFPNPANDKIILTYVPASTGNIKIVLSNIDGRKIKEIANGINEAGKTYRQNINISKYPTGVYLIQVWNEHSVTTKKLIIQH